MGIFKDPSWSDVIYYEEQVKELKAENEALIEGLGIANKYVNKYHQTLQEIKEIAENAYCLTNYTNKDMANFAKQILCLITKAENEKLKEENEKLNKMTGIFSARLCEKYRQALQEIKGVVTALYMNNWLQMNKTARKSIQLLQELITKAEIE